MAVMSIIVIVLVLAITYMHFSEGFFSALISAISAVLAAVLAVSYTEPLVHVLLHGAGADCIYAICLVMLFVVGYTVIRTLFDKLVSGNVRTPATFDKAGGALMGVVAGTFAVGIFVIALQMLPFGPTISFFGYSRFPVVGNRAVYVKGGPDVRDLDAFVQDQMEDATLDPAKQKSLWLPVDDVVMNTVYHLSDGGSLAGARPLASIHPDWLAELYGLRLGQQTGNRRVALVLPGSDPVGVTAVFDPASIPTFDGYGPATTKDLAGTTDLRPPGYKFPYGAELKPSGGLIPLVIRVHLRTTVTDDSDKLFRFSPGSVRLVTRPQLTPDEFGPAKDYYPVGTLEDGTRVVLNRVDDPLIVNLASGDSGFDAVFMVDQSVLVGSVKDKTVTEVAPGTFLVVKQTAVLDISGTKVDATVTPPGNAKLQRPDYLDGLLHPKPH